MRKRKNAVGAGRMRQAARELVKAYIHGVESAALDDVFELLAWNQGIVFFSSEIGPSALFQAYKLIKNSEKQGKSREDICSALREKFGEKNPEMKIVGNAKTFTLLKQFFGTGALSEDRMLEVGEGDALSLGLHRLRFLLAPMVHWPEVMAAYEEKEKILFSADAFGRFGSLERTARAPWAPQARRYYYNIVGKYGAQVQALLKKISALEIQTICPLHGPVLTEDLEEYLRLYDLWSQWKPEEPEGVLIVHASIHGNTAYASESLKEKLEGRGARVTMCDLTVTDLSYAVTSAFYCGKLVLACSTYDGGLFPPMKAFLEHLQAKGFRNRRIGLMENGSWAPAAARLMRAELEKMKELRLCETEVSLRGALNQTSEAQMDALVAEICAE